MAILKRSFYLKEDVVGIARDLIGKHLFSSAGGIITGGMITETEAYAGVTDRASHAFGGRRTARTEVMYSVGGTAYIYLCYGVHSLFNVVTNIEGIPHAVLIRAISPTKGLPEMLQRTGKAAPGKGFTDGPGKVTKALGIHFSETGLDLTAGAKERDGRSIWIEDPGTVIPASAIEVSTRIGVQYAGEDALLPYRFLYRGKK